MDKFFENAKDSSKMTRDEELKKFNAEYYSRAQHKDWNSVTIDFSKMMGMPVPKKTNISSMNFDKLSEIQISNISIGINKKKFLTLKTFSHPLFSGRGITVLADDKVGGFIKVTIYVYGDAQNWELADSEFPIGTLIKIKEPQYKQFLDGCFGIRVDNLQDFWQDSKPKEEFQESEQKLDNKTLLKSVKFKSAAIINLQKISAFDQAQDNFVKLTETEEVFSKIAKILGNLGSIKYINNEIEFGTLLLYFAQFIDNSYVNAFNKLEKCFNQNNDEHSLKEIKEIKKNHETQNNQDRKCNFNKEMRRLEFIDNIQNPNLMLLEQKQLFIILDQKNRQETPIDKDFNELNEEAKQYMKDKEQLKADKYFQSALHICSELGSQFFNFSKSLQQNGFVQDSLVSILISIFFQKDQTKSLAHLFMCLNHFNILQNKSKIFDREIHEQICTLKSEQMEQWNKLESQDAELCTLLNQKIKLSSDFKVNYQLLKNSQNIYTNNDSNRMNFEQKNMIEMLEMTGKLKKFKKFGYGQIIPKIQDEFLADRGYPSCSNKNLIISMLEDAQYKSKGGFMDLYTLTITPLPQLKDTMNQMQRFNTLIQDNEFFNRFNKAKINSIVDLNKIKLIGVESAVVCNQSNVAERSETYTGNHIHVSIGFMDLSVFINGKFEDSFFTNENAIIKFYGYDADPFCIAKTLVIKELLINQSADIVFEVWQSPLWSRGTKYKFQKAVYKVLNELDIEETESTKENYEKLKQILLKWLYTDLVTLKDARFKWIKDRYKLLYLCDLAKLEDRLDMMDYELGGSLIENPVEGNICMFSYGNIDSDECILWNFPIQELDKQNNKLNLKQMILDQYKKKINKLKYQINEDKIEIHLKNKLIDFKQKKSLDQIKQLKPDMISYSNLVDQWSETQFHQIATYISNENTIHQVYSNNQILFFKGANLLDQNDINYQEMALESFNYIKEISKDNGIGKLNLFNSNSQTVMNYTQYYLCATKFNKQIDFFISKSNSEFEDFDSRFYNFNPLSRNNSCEIHMQFKQKMNNENKKDERHAELFENAIDAIIQGNQKFIPKQSIKNQKPLVDINDDILWNIIDLITKCQGKFLLSQREIESILKKVDGQGLISYYEIGDSIQSELISMNWKKMNQNDNMTKEKFNEYNFKIDKLLNEWAIYYGNQVSESKIDHKAKETEIEISELNLQKQETPIITEIENISNNKKKKKSKKNKKQKKQNMIQVHPIHDHDPDLPYDFFGNEQCPYKYVPDMSREFQEMECDREIRIVRFPSRQTDQESVNECENLADFLWTFQAEEMLNMEVYDAVTNERLQQRRK